MSLTTKEKGDRGEKIAAGWLEAHGLRILDRNWRHRHLELDIIASGPLLCSDGSIEDNLYGSTSDKLYERTDVLSKAGRQMFLHIVEVRSRTSSYRADAQNAEEESSPLVSPQYTVLPGKQKFLISAADAYCRQKQIHLEVVFDVVSIEFLENGHRISFIPEAFRPKW